MKDRLAKYPGRYNAVVDTEKIEKGAPFNIVLSRNDEPTEEGTPYNKEAVLPDDLSALICAGIEDPTPADAFRGVYGASARSGFGYGGEELPVVEGTTTDEINAGILELIKAMPRLFCTRQFKCKNPVTKGGHLYGTIYKQNDSNAIVVLYQLTYRYELRGQYTQGVWEEWEWSNPPMDLNMEYRTTERFNGKPVYIKLINGGLLANNASKFVTLSGEAVNVIEVKGFLKRSSEPGYFPLPRFGTSGSLSAFVYAAYVNNAQTVANVISTEDMSTYTVFLSVKYTKAT